MSGRGDMSVPPHGNVAAPPPGDDDEIRPVPDFEAGRGQGEPELPAAVVHRHRPPQDRSPVLDRANLPGGGLPPPPRIVQFQGGNIAAVDEPDASDDEAGDHAPGGPSAGQRAVAALSTAAQTVGQGVVAGARMTGQAAVSSGKAIGRGATAAWQATEREAAAKWNDASDRAVALGRSIKNNTQPGTVIHDVLANTAKDGPTVLLATVTREVVNALTTYYASDKAKTGLLIGEAALTGLGTVALSVSHVNTIRNPNSSQADRDSAAFALVAEGFRAVAGGVGLTAAAFEQHLTSVAPNVTKDYVYGLVRDGINQIVRAPDGEGVLNDQSVTDKIKVIVINAALYIIEQIAVNSLQSSPFSKSGSVVAGELLEGRSLTSKDVGDVILYSVYNSLGEVVDSNVNDLVKKLVAGVRDGGDASFMGLHWDGALRSIGKQISINTPKFDIDKMVDDVNEAVFKNAFSRMYANAIFHQYAPAIQEKIGKTSVREAAQIGVNAVEAAVFGTCVGASQISKLAYPSSGRRDPPAVSGGATAAVGAAAAVALVGGAAAGLATQN